MAKTTLYFKSTGAASSSATIEWLGGTGWLVIDNANAPDGGAFSEGAFVSLSSSELGSWQPSGFPVNNVGTYEFSAPAGFVTITPAGSLGVRLTLISDKD